MALLYRVPRARRRVGGVVWVSWLVGGRDRDLGELSVAPRLSGAKVIGSLVN